MRNGRECRVGGLCRLKFLSRQKDPFVLVDSNNLRDAVKILLTRMKLLRANVPVSKSVSSRETVWYDADGTHGGGWSKCRLPPVIHTYAKPLTNERKIEMRTMIEIDEVMGAGTMSQVANVRYGHIVLESSP